MAPRQHEVVQQHRARPNQPLQGLEQPDVARLVDVVARRRGRVDADLVEKLVNSPRICAKRGADDLSKIQAEVFRCTATARAPSNTPAPPAGTPPPPPPGPSR